MRVAIVGPVVSGASGGYRSYMQAYAPELNPDEFLNGDLKFGVAARAPARPKPELAKAARSHLLTLQHRPDRVRRFFEHPRVTYAA